MRFSNLELMQLGAIAAGALVALGLLVALVRWLRSMDAIWPQCAKELGLVFKEVNTGGALAGTRRQQRSLEGVLSGVPIRLVSTWERSGRRSSTQTLVRAKAAQPAKGSFSVQLKLGPTRETGFHVVTTGDAGFDSRVRLTSDAPDAVRALMNAEVRAAVLALPLEEAGLSCQDGELCLAHHRAELERHHLDAPLRVVIAAAKASFDARQPPARPAPQVAAAKATLDARQPPAPPGALPRPDLKQYLDQLGAAHGFTAEQLAANRAGQLHPGQRERLGRTGIGPAVAGLIFALLCLAGGVGGALALYDDFRKPISPTDMNGIYALGGAGVVLALVISAASILGLVNVGRRRRALLGGCSVVEGIVQKSSVTGAVQTQSYTIDRRSFFAPRSGWELVTAGARYRIYFIGGLPGERLELLSLEPG